ncbi:MAG: hypothetical protein GXO47_06735 [Chlorobi bacterium]|nr:hypothetical protein [Chlorobiota bacterium]
MKKAFKPILLAVISIVFFSACQSSGTKTKTTEPQIKKEDLKEEVKKVVYPLPTSFEVTEMLNRIEASYILSISNPPEKVDSYITEKEKALALGVYGADLSYASTYNQKQRTLEYMNVSKKLLEELDISAAVDPDIIEKIENAENNKEELVNIITNSFYSTYEYLNKNNRAPVSLLVMAGSWVEALYIATHISDETFNNKEMVTIIMNQKDHLNKLMALLEQYKDNPDIADVIKILTPLSETYKNIEAGSITKKQMLKIKEQVAAARQEIVK